MNSSLSAQDRREHWQETFLREECDDWDYGQWIAELIHHNFEYAESIFGAEAVAGPLAKILEASRLAEGSGEHSWRGILGDATPVSWTIWPIADKFRKLGLFARYGVTEQSVDTSSREEHIKALISDCAEFLRNSPIEAMTEKEPERQFGEQLKMILALAQSRWNLDHGDGGIDPASLAIFGGLSEGRIRNMMSGSDRVFENIGGKVSAQSAALWLRDRPAFFDSIWNRDEHNEEETVAPSELIEKVFFVPVSRDRSIFHPGLKRGAGYYVGPKGAEDQIVSYQDALELLQHMPEPYWRRPNQAGNWGIVKGTDWVRVTKEELERHSVGPQRATTS